MIFGQIEESKKTRALGEGKSLQATLLAFKKDVGVWPYNSGTFGATTSDVTVLVTGDPATFAADLTRIGTLGYDATKMQNLKDHMVDATAATAIYGPKWKGPYLVEAPLDPWGKPYIIPIELLNPANTSNAGVPAFIFSAGPNGVYDTDRGAQSLGL